MQLSSIDLNLLVVLDAVLETHSVKSAATRLSLSPSATSHALSRLRALFDDPILVRAGKDMVPSARAARIRPQVRRALTEVRRVLELEPELDPARLRRGFRVAATDYAELLIVRAVSDDVAASAPGVDVYSRSLITPGVELLRGGDCDIAIGVFIDVPDDINREALFHDDFVCVMRRDHPSATKRLTLKQYLGLGHVLVSPRGEARGVVDMMLARDGKSRRVARTVASFLVAPHLVRGADFVLTLPARVAHLLAEELGLVVRKPPVELSGFDLQMAWHARDDADAGHRWLRERFREAAATVMAL